MFCCRVEDVIGRLDLEEQEEISLSVSWLERPMCSQGVSNLISKEFKDMLYIIRGTYYTLLLLPCNKPAIIIILTYGCN